MVAAFLIKDPGFRCIFKSSSSGGTGEAASTPAPAPAAAAAPCSPTLSHSLEDHPEACVATRLAQQWFLARLAMSEQQDFRRAFSPSFLGTHLQSSPKTHRLEGS